MTLLGREEVKIWLKTWEQLGGNWKKIPGGCLCALRGSSTDQRLKSKCISSTTPYKYGILRHHQRICRCHHHHLKTNQFKKSTKKLIFCLRFENWDQIIHFDSKPATKLWIFKLQAAKVLKTGSIQGSVCIISLMKSDFFYYYLLFLSARFLAGNSVTHKFLCQDFWDFQPFLLILPRIWVIVFSAGYHSCFLNCSDFLDIEYFGMKIHPYKSTQLYNVRIV